MDQVVIVATGVANVASVSAAVRRCGFDPVLTIDPDHISSAERVVLPGVGSFAAGMQHLSTRALIEVIRDRVTQQRPLLAICLGMQLLCKSSEESPGVAGIGVIDVDVRRLPADVIVPQFGWNSVTAGETSLVSSGYVYYANSYCVTDPPMGWTIATTTYGKTFIAAMEHGCVLACQFHPELSGPWGTALIKRWLMQEEVNVPC